MIKQIINIENEDTDDLQYTCVSQLGHVPKITLLKVKLPKHQSGSEK